MGQDVTQLVMSGPLPLALPVALAAGAVSFFSPCVAFPRRHAMAVMRAGGALLIVVGLAQVSGVWGRLIAHLQGWISGYQLPL